MLVLLFDNLLNVEDRFYVKSSTQVANRQHATGLDGPLVTSILSSEEAAGIHACPGSDLVES